MTRRVRRALTERVQVFGLPDEIDWPAGAVVEVLKAWPKLNGAGEPVEFEAFDVVGPDGKRATLPARLLRAEHQSEAA